jgi:hypothetical protein
MLNSVIVQHPDGRIVEVPAAGYLLPAGCSGVWLALDTPTFLLPAGALEGATVTVAVHSLFFALLQRAIVGWAGPAFEGLPYTPDLVGDLDLRDPLIAAVCAVIERTVAQTATMRLQPPVVATA